MTDCVTLSAWLILYDFMPVYTCLYIGCLVTTGIVYGYMHVLGWWSGLVIVISSQAYSQANIVIHSKQQESKYVIKHRHIQTLITRRTNVF